MVIFVQSTFVLATFVHIRNISAVTESILAKLGPKFLEAQNFCIQNCLDPKFCWTLIFWTKIFWEITFLLKFSLDPKLLGLKFFGHGLFLDQQVFGPNFFLSKTTTTITATTTTNLMGFDTIEIYLVLQQVSKQQQQQQQEQQQQQLKCFFLI